VSLPKVKKKTIFAYWEKGEPFFTWKRALTLHFYVRSFSKLEKFLDALFFNPPDLLYYYYEKSPEGLEILVKDIKLHFNLVRLPLILILHKLEPQRINQYLQAIDDILFLDTPVEEVLLRTELALRRIERVSDNNPLTGLPGNVSIEKKLMEILQSPNYFAVAYVDLDNFKAYNDLYGFTKGDEMIKNVARVLVNSVNNWTKEGFVGHIGGDDFVFIVPLELVEKVSQEIIRNFSLLLPSFLKKSDLERGYFIAKDRRGNRVKFPLPSLSIAIVPVHQGKFKHIGEIAERASQVKKVVKAMPGSAYFIDRRS